MIPVRALSGGMSLLGRHPHLTRLLLRPVAMAPILRRRLPVLARATFGCTAFEVHDVDVDKGRIGIGGVDEIMWSSRFLDLFHEVLAQGMGEEAKDRALYEVGKRGGHWEISEAIRQGRWAPQALVDLVEGEGTLDRVRTDPDLARFFELSMGLALRLIINEGGWGVPEMELSSDPVRVYLANSKEAERLGPADHPTCSLSAGVIAGYTGRILGMDVDAEEVECMAMGAPRCVFELGT